MYAIYGNIYHQYTPNVSIYTIHGSYGGYNCNMIAILEPKSSMNYGAFTILIVKHR